LERKNMKKCKRCEKEFIDLFYLNKEKRRTKTSR
jgi:hypothetical protein